MKYTDPIDDLPVFSHGKGAVRQERVPGTPSIKGSMLKAAHKVGQRIGTGRGGSQRGGHPNRGKKATPVKPAVVSHRRVIIKARYVQHGRNGAGLKAARLHLKYVEREGVNQDGGKGRLFSAAGRAVDGDAFLERSAGDPHQFRFIVSPEDAGELDLETFTQDLMAQVEQDLGRSVDWLAVNHHNTENPHTHIVVRGRDADGKELRIDRAYLSQGFRDRAREMVTRELGPRLEHEIAQGLNNEVQAERFTSLDYQIDKVSHEKLLASGPCAVVSLGEPGSVVHPNLDRHVVGRLRHLQLMGLAEEIGPREYALHPDFQRSLKELGERNDIIKTMHRAHHGEPGQYRIYDAQRDAVEIQGTLRQKGLHDELNDRHYAIVDTAEGASYFVKLPPRTDLDSLQVGQVIRVTSATDPWLKPADLVIAEHARQHGGVYRVDEHVHALAGDGQFAKRRIDPMDYAQAHARRAQRLVRFGLLTATENGFSVPADLVDQLRTRDREQPNPRAIQVGVVDARSIEAQIEARGAAWLDDVDLEAAGTTGFGAALREARRLRAAYLQQHFDLEPGAKDLQQQLARIERADLASARTAQSGLEEAPLARGVRRRGTLVDKLTAPSGKAFGVFETEREFSLVPWQTRYQRSMNRPMTFGMDRSGTPFAQPLGRGLTRS